MNGLKYSLAFFCSVLLPILWYPLFKSRLMVNFMSISRLHNLNLKKYLTFHQVILCKLHVST